MSRTPLRVPGIAAALFAVMLALGGCASGGYTALRTPAPKGPPVTLAQANKWWQNAQAQLAANISFPKKPKNGVWHAVLELPRAGHAPMTKKWQDLQLIVDLPDSPALRQFIDKQGVLYAGAVFDIEGWAVTQYNKTEMNVLRFKVPGADRIGSIYFYCYDWKNFIFFDANDCSLEGVRQRAEPYLRAHFFQLRPKAAAAQTQAAASRAMKPEVHLLAVTVNPVSVPAGSEIQLVVTYVVKGVLSDTAVMERRTVRKDGAAIIDLPSAVTRSAGTFTSQQSVRIPSSASAGSYTFHAEVSLQSAVSQGDALFEVR